MRISTCPNCLNQLLKEKEENKNILDRYAINLAMGVGFGLLRMDFNHAFNHMKQGLLFQTPSTLSLQLVGCNY